MKKLFQIIALSLVMLCLPKHQAQAQNVQALVDTINANRGIAAQISNDNLTGFKRYVQAKVVPGFSMTGNRFFKINFEIYNVAPSGKVFPAGKSSYSATVTNSQLVNPANGNPIPPTDTVTQGIGEYNYLWDVVESGSVTFFELIKSYIPRLDTEGKFDD